MRPIDADALKERLYNLYCKTCTTPHECNEICELFWLMKHISEEPTIENEKDSRVGQLCYVFRVNHGNGRGNFIVDSPWQIRRGSTKTVTICKRPYCKSYANKIGSLVFFNLDEAIAVCKKYKKEYKVKEEPEYGRNTYEKRCNIAND